MKIQLTQQIIVSNKSNKFAQLDELCFLSKNLYNVALYHIRQYYKENHCRQHSQSNLQSRCTVTSRLTR